MPHFTQAERHALAETLRDAGPSAPTLCGDWDTAHLAAHLVLRERSVVELAGRLPVAALQRRAEQVVDVAAREPYDELVAQVAAGPSWRDLRGPVPTAWLWSLPPVRDTANVLEYLVHHEDVRRAEPGWMPRELGTDALGVIWARLRAMAKLTLRTVPVGLVLVAPGFGEIRTRAARRGAASVTATGDPVELAMFAFGRGEQATLRWDGADADVAAARGADISL